MVEIVTCIKASSQIQICSLFLQLFSTVDFSEPRGTFLNMKASLLKIPLDFIFWAHFRPSSMLEEQIWIYKLAFMQVTTSTIFMAFVLKPMTFPE